jgi:hypothetical protein
MTPKKISIFARILTVLVLFLSTITYSPPAVEGYFPIIPWTSVEINTSNPGSTQSSGDEYTVTASGTGIGGVIDSFRFVYLPSKGSMEFTTKITEWDNGGFPLAKGGLMIRSSTNPDSAFAFIGLTRKNGLRFQWRSGGGENTHEKSAPSNFSLPVWIKLDKNGSNLSAYYSEDGSSWSQIGTTVEISLPDYYLFGMAVTSAREGNYAITTFKSPQWIEKWTSMDIGTSYTGQTIYEGEGIQVVASGAGVGGSTDSFRFVYDYTNNNFWIRGKVDSFVSNDLEGPQAGLMLRASTTPDSAYGYIFIDDQGDIYFSWRAADGEESDIIQVMQNPGEEIWLALFYSSSSLTYAISLNGESFTGFGNENVALPETYLAGPATSASSDGSFVSAYFLDVEIKPYLIWVDPIFPFP